MEEKFRCEQCNRDFKDAEGLNSHNSAKHPELIEKPKKPFPVKKIRNWAIFIVILALIIWGIMALNPKSNIGELNVNLSGKNVSIPLEPVHWHPHLPIKINGERIDIPKNIGISIGNTVDTDMGMDMGMAPAHTHTADGIIHLENNNPSKKPETLALGYFFYVWDKQFSSSCIFDYCTDKGELKMYVNGEENTEFENYIMGDLDEIIIEYISNEN